MFMYLIIELFYNNMKKYSNNNLYEGIFFLRIIL